MRKLTLWLLMALLATTAPAQTLEEWFNQKKTQQRYLLEQLASLRLYAQLTQEGYALAREGLSIIGLETGAEQALHAGFFRGLAQVSPSPGGDRQLEAAQSLHLRLRQLRHQSQEQVNTSGVFRAAEIAYAARVWERLVLANRTALEEMRVLLTPHELLLRTAERHERLEVLYRQVYRDYLAAVQLSEQFRLLAAARLRATGELEAAYLLHGRKGGR